MPNFSGVWSLSQQFQGRGQGLWPAAPGAPTIGAAAAASTTSVAVAFTPPACAGVPATLTYTATSTPGCFVGTGAASPIIVSGLTTGSSYTFRVKATNATGTGPCSASSNAAVPIAPGSQSYTSAGTYSWVAPANVSSVSVVAVGGGAGGGWLGSGGGGGLGWRNTISVTPGASYTVVVGAGGTGAGSQFAIPGTTSYFCNASLVSGGGGLGGGSMAGGSYTGQGGGNGGNSNYNTGAGGAGGYSGNGGQGGGGAGAGGGGGGGGGGGICNTSYPCCCAPCGTYQQVYVNSSAGSGGVGLLGQGSSGAGGASGTFNSSLAQGAAPGSGGVSGNNPTSTQGNGGAGGLYGGAGAAGGYCYNVYSGYYRQGSGGAGRNGAVRIVWPGGGRLFPSTCVGSP